MTGWATLVRAAAIVPALAAAANASRDLAACPALVPSAPAALADRAAARCQRAADAAARRFVARTLDAVTACLARVQAGTLAGDGAALCVPEHRLSDGAAVAPGDAATAARVDAATAALARTVARRCAGAPVPALGGCAGDAAGFAACIARDHVEHLAHLVDATHGAAPPAAGRAARRCQAAIARAGRTFLQRALRAHGACLARRARAAAGSAAACLGEVAGGAFVPPADRRTAARLRAAATRLARRLRACDDAALGALDACGRDPAALAACLRCTLGREALLLVQATRDGVADRAATAFVDWAALRNPILGRDDRSLKDQALVRHDGRFHLFASQRFEGAAPPPLVFRSTDLRVWEEAPWPWTATAEGPIDAGSPSLLDVDGVWHATFQARPPASADADAREIFHATSADLVTWSPAAAFTRGLAANPIIDGALARAGDAFLLVFKDRVLQRTYVTASLGPAPDGRWHPPLPVVAGSTDPVLGFAENYQLVVIDGRQHAVATARDPEPERCGHPIYDAFTCDHEPYLYAVPGAGPALDGWTAWTRRRRLRIPYEAWNPFMHANTGFLSDWRDHDGFFYLSYAGSTDGDSFDLRGHGRIGLARSRDLVHWRVPGDLRD